MISEFISYLLSKLFIRISKPGEMPTPPWLSPETINPRNYIDGSVSLIAIIVGILLLIAAIRCDKKYRGSTPKRHFILTLFLFTLAIIFLSVPFIAHNNPYFFPDLKCSIYSCPPLFNNDLSDWTPSIK